MHQSDEAHLNELIQTIKLLEAKTHRASATEIITKNSKLVFDAVDTLKRSRLSSTARLNFRAKISGMLRRSATKVATEGWLSGGGAATDPKLKDLVRMWMTDQQARLSAWMSTIKSDEKLINAKNRTQMYVDSLMGLYNLAWASAKESSGEFPTLPATPKDSTTFCRTYCNCRWRIEKVNENQYNAYWTLGQSEHCSHCVCRSKVWNPLKIKRVEGVWQYTTSSKSQCDLFR